MPPLKLSNMGLLWSQKEPLPRGFWQLVQWTRRILTISGEVCLKLGLARKVHLEIKEA